MNFAIRTENLGRVYKISGGKKTEPKSLTALQDVNLEVQPGELFGLLGPNGAGKTTLIKILTTLLAPTTGRAWVADFDAVKEPDKVRPRINMVSGGESSGYGLLTVRENLWMFSQFYGLSSAVANQRIRDLLEVVGMSDRLNTKSSDLSTGLRQKMSIVRGFLTDPDVLFLDEKDEWIKHEWAAYIGAKEENDPPANHNWKEYSGTVEIPDNTKTIVIGLQMYGPGTVWFDELQVSYLNETTVSSKPDKLRAEDLIEEGWKLWKERKLAEAEKKFEEAIAADPTNDGAYQGLGWAQLNQGKKNNAKASKAITGALSNLPGIPGLVGTAASATPGQEYLQRRALGQIVGQELYTAPPKTAEERLRKTEKELSKLAEETGSIDAPFVGPVSLKDVATFFADNAIETNLGSVGGKAIKWLGKGVKSVAGRAAVGLASSMATGATGATASAWLAGQEITPATPLAGAVLGGVFGTLAGGIGTLHEWRASTRVHPVGEGDASLFEKARWQARELPPNVEPGDIRRPLLVEPMPTGR